MRLLVSLIVLAAAFADITVWADGLNLKVKEQVLLESTVDRIVALESDAALLASMNGFVYLIRSSGEIKLVSSPISETLKNSQALALAGGRHLLIWSNEEKALMQYFSAEGELQESCEAPIAVNRFWSNPEKPPLKLQDGNFLIAAEEGLAVLSPKCEVLAQWVRDRYNIFQPFLTLEGNIVIGYVDAIYLLSSTLKVLKKLDAVPCVPEKSGKCAPYDRFYGAPWAQPTQLPDGRVMVAKSGVDMPSSTLLVDPDFSKVQTLRYFTGGTHEVLGDGFLISPSTNSLKLIDPQFRIVGDYPFVGNFVDDQGRMHLADGRYAYFTHVDEAHSAINVVSYDHLGKIRIEQRTWNSDDFVVRNPVQMPNGLIAAKSGYSMHFFDPKDLSTYSFKPSREKYLTDKLFVLSSGKILVVEDADAEDNFDLRRLLLISIERILK